jgi:hypothetical protein
MSRMMFWKARTFAYEMWLPGEMLQLVRGGFANDALELLRVNVAVAVLVKVVEGLSDSFSLQTTQHLGELRVGHAMPVLAVANI